MNHKNKGTVSYDFYSRLGATIVSLRKAAHISQKELGDLLGIHQTAVCRVENGSQGLTPTQLFELSTFFGVPIDSIFAGTVNYAVVAAKFGKEYSIPKQYLTHTHSKLRESFPVLDFFKLTWDDAKAKKVLAKLEMDTELYLFPDTPISPEFQLDLLRQSLTSGILNSKTLSTLVDQTRSEKMHGVMHGVYESSISALPLLQTLIFNMHRYETNFKYQIEEQSVNRLAFSVQPEPHMKEIAYRDSILEDILCRYKKAYFSNFPLYIHKKPVAIQEKECHFHGSKRCVYVLKSA